MATRRELWKALETVHPAKLKMMVAGMEPVAGSPREGTREWTSAVISIILDKAKFNPDYNRNLHAELGLPIAAKVAKPVNKPEASWPRRALAWCLKPRQLVVAVVGTVVGGTILMRLEPYVKTQPDTRILPTVRGRRATASQPKTRDQRERSRIAQEPSTAPSKRYLPETTAGELIRNLFGEEPEAGLPPTARSIAQAGRELKALGHYELYDDRWVPEPGWIGTVSELPGCTGLILWDRCPTWAVTVREEGSNVLFKAITKDASAADLRVGDAVRVRGRISMHIDFELPLVLKDASVTSR